MDQTSEIQQVVVATIRDEMAVCVPSSIAASRKSMPQS
jgi:hypothetical protein